MEQLEYDKLYRDAPVDKKVDMIYKVYWNPKKWVKPLGGINDDIKDETC